MDHYLYLHIGIPKTGTSSLQEYLAVNSEGLEKQGFFFDTKEPFSGQIKEIDPDASKYMNGHWIKTSLDEVACKIFNRGSFFIKNMDTKALSQMEDADFSDYSVTFKRYIASTRQLLEKQNVILSNELLWLIPQIYLKQLYMHLDERIKVIVYLRRQDFLMESFWNHLIRRTTMTTPFDEYVNMFWFFPELKKIVQFGQTLDEITEIVGKDNLIVRIYGAKDKEGNPFDIKKDFADAVGLEFIKNGGSKNKNKNTRITGQMVEYLRVFNSIIKEMPQEMKPAKELREKIMNILSCYPDRDHRDLYFKPEERKKFLAAFEDGNAYVSKKYLEGRSLSDEGVPMDAGATVHTLSAEEIERLRFLTALALS